MPKINCCDLGPFFPFFISVNHATFSNYVSQKKYVPMFLFNPSPFITNVKGKEVVAVAKKADRQR